MGFVHAYQATHGCSKTEAMIAVNRSNPEARVDFIKNANPGRADELFERAPEAPAAAAGPYNGKPYMELVEEYRDKKNCTLVDAMFAVNRKHPAARADYIRRHNPHLVK